MSLARLKYVKYEDAKLLHLAQHVAWQLDLVKKYQIVEVNKMSD